MKKIGIILAIGTLALATVAYGIIARSPLTAIEFDTVSYTVVYNPDESRTVYVSTVSRRIAEDGSVVDSHFQRATLDEYLADVKANLLPGLNVVTAKAEVIQHMKIASRWASWHGVDENVETNPE